MASWSEIEERKLLMCIIDPDAKPKWDEVAARMGDGKTGSACRYVPHFEPD
jgi:Myb-like DNA-binding domain